MQGAGLAADTLATLDPEKFLSQGGDSDEILEKWIKAVDSAIITAKVSAEVEKKNKERESDELNNQANEGKQAEALIESGKITSPLPSLDTRSDLLLADAFARTAAQKRSR